MSQGEVQGSVRSYTGTAYAYEGDWHALFDQYGIQAGAFNGRLLAWLNLAMGTSYTNLSGAKFAFAAQNGAANWPGLGVFSLAFPGAIADYDFKRAFYTGSALTTTRALSKYVDDSTGNWTLVPANTLARSDKGALLETAATNQVRNNSMQGAVAGIVGSGGALPTLWGNDPVPAGITLTVGTPTTVLGVECVPITLAGTPTATATMRLFVDANTAGPAAVNAQAWILSHFQAVSAGSNANLTIQPFVQELSSGSTNLQQDIGTAITPGATLARSAYAVTLSNASVAFIRSGLIFTVTINQPVNITLLIGWPQLEQTSAGAPSSPIRTTNAAVTRPADVVTAPITVGAEYTLFAQSSMVVATGGGGVASIIRVDDGTSTNAITLREGTVIAGADILATNAGATTVDTSSIATPVGQTNKYAARVKQSDMALSLNGSAVAIDSNPGAVRTLAPPSGVNRLTFGATNGAPKYFERIAVIGTAQSNAQLQSMTT